MGRLREGKDEEQQRSKGGGTLGFTVILHTHAHTHPSVGMLIYIDIHMYIHSCYDACMILYTY